MRARSTKASVSAAKLSGESSGRTRTSVARKGAK